MFGVKMPLCNRIFCCIFGWYFYVKSDWNMKKIFCCPALELFHCLAPLFHCLPPLYQYYTFPLSTPVENGEATWKKATKCNKYLNTYEVAMQLCSVAHFSVLDRRCNFHLRRSWMFGPDKVRPLAVGHSRSHRIKIRKTYVIKVLISNHSN